MAGSQFLPHSRPVRPAQRCQTQILRPQSLVLPNSRSILSVARLYTMASVGYASRLQMRLRAKTISTPFIAKWEKMGIL